MLNARATLGRPGERNEYDENLESFDKAHDK